MSEKHVKKSDSILKRTVKNIKNRKAKSFIRIEGENEQKRVSTRKALTPGKDEVPTPGILYIAHLPPGFYEKELLSYFSQFGQVSKVKLERSKKTGRSKGYAFIQFKFAEVAKIAAETMNNYILFDRILKAKLVNRKYWPKNFWKTDIVPTQGPTSETAQRRVEMANMEVLPTKEKKRFRKRLCSLENMIERLKAKGINYSYKPAIRKEIPDSPSTDGKYVRLIHTDTPVLEIDESDQEIEFMTPPNVVKKKLSVSKVSKSPLNKTQNSRKILKGKIKKEKIVTAVSASKLQEIKDTPVKKALTPNALVKKVSPEEILKGKIKKEKKEKIVTAVSASKLQEIKDTPVKKALTPNALVKVSPEEKKKNIKTRNQQFSQKLKSLSQGKGCRKLKPVKAK